MLIAFKTFEQASADVEVPADVPINYPWFEIRNIPEQEYNNYIENEFQIMPIDEYENFKKSLIPVVPSEVSPRQIRQALFLSAAITEETIDLALNTLPEPEKTLALIEWKYATTFDRNNDLVDGVAALLGWTSQQLDDLWIYAATL